MKRNINVRGNMDLLVYVRFFFSYVSVIFRKSLDFNLKAQFVGVQFKNKILSDLELEFEKNYRNTQYRTDIEICDVRIRITR